MMTPAPTFRGRLWRWTKRLTLAGFLAVLALGPAIGFGLPALSRTAWARTRAEKALTKALGAPVEISSMAFRWKSGLSVKGLESSSGLRAEELTILPRYWKVFRGQVRVRAVLHRPELTLTDGAIAMQLPKLPKEGLRLEKLEIRDGAITTVAGIERKTVHLRGLNLAGDARLEKRTLHVDLASLSGDCDGLAFSGKGTLKASHEGVSGRVDLNETAAEESSSLKEALRTLRVTMKKPPVLSEPY